VEAGRQGSCELPPVSIAFRLTRPFGLLEHCELDHEYESPLPFGKLALRTVFKTIAYIQTLESSLPFG
jgi:hypothetical protein